ncbi:HDOD domain-containing protein [Endothiovibrio diazotrophicus]
MDRLLSPREPADEAPAAGVGFDVAAALDRLQRLPSLSLVALEILRHLEDPGIDARRLGGMIARDQGIAAAVLKLANSAFFGVSRRIATIADAIVVLGFHSTRSLILATTFIERFPITANGYDRTAFWRHAIGTGVCAKVLAQRLGHNGEEAFAAGLLHDIGRLVLDVCFPDELTSVLETRTRQACPLIAAERAVLGFDHAWLGEQLARRWQLPATMQQAIGRHHRPDDEEPAPRVDVVHLANVLSHALELDGSGDPVPPLAAGAWQRLGLGFDTLATLLPEIEQLNGHLNLMLETAPETEESAT